MLERKLQQLVNNSPVSLDHIARQRMKQHLLATIKSNATENFGFVQVVDHIKQIAKQLKPSEYFRILLREKLIAVIEFNRTAFLQRLRVLFTGKFAKRFVATTITVVFLITAFFNFGLQVERVSAAVITVLEEVNGTVTVIRGKKSQPGRTGFSLKPDDIIQTGSASGAVIRFLDQSIGRLDENTEMSITSLSVNPANKTETVVEVVLHRGRLWTRVINLINNLSRFEVKVKNAVAVAKKKAAFNVSVSAKGHATVSAVKNQIDLVVATPKEVIATTLMKGFTAEIKEGNAVASRTVSATAAPAAGDEWVSENLAQDKVYIEQVKQETKEKLQAEVGVLPGSPFYAVKELSESTKIALTFDEVEKQNKLLLVAQEKLAEAEVLLAKGDNRRAGKLLKEFQKIIQDVFTWFTTHEAADFASMLELRAKIVEVLDTYQKQFALILPADPLYGLKDTIAKTQLLIATDPLEKTQEQIEQASDKLLEAHDLVEQGDTARATAQVNAYSEAIAQVASDVKQLPLAAKEKAVTALLENKAQDLKVLESISAVPADSPSPLSTAALNNLQLDLGSSTRTATSTTPSLEFLVSSTQSALPMNEVSGVDQLHKTVEEAKTEALTKIGEAILEVKQPSVPVLEKLEELKNLEVNGQKSFVDFDSL